MDEHPPPDSPVEALDESQPIQFAELVAELRRLHAEIESYTTTKPRWWPTKAEEWVRDMWAYDHVLVATVEMLGHPTPPPPPKGAQRRLSPPDRGRLEQILADGGVELGGREGAE